jgi:quinol monooxygenase YgiN
LSAYDVQQSEIFIFGRFHAREGKEKEVELVILDVAKPTQQEPGCLAYGAFRSVRDPRLFFIYRRWTDQASFDRHAELPHTLRFLERVQPLIDHELDVNRTISILS